MRSFILLLGNLLILLIHQCKKTSAAPTLPINETPSHLLGSSAFQNLSGSFDPDPLFKFKSSYGTKRISFVSLLQNAVNGQAILAHQPFGDKIKDLKGITLYSCQDASIEIEVKSPFRKFDNRIAVWGLYAAMHEMATSNDFTEALFELFWDESNVATLSIWTSKPRQPEITNTLDAEARQISNTSLTGKSDLQPSFRYLRNGARLSLLEIFMAVLATLQSLAYWNDDVVVYPFTCKAEGFNTLLQISFGRGPRTTKPYLLVEYVIDTIRQIPGFMLKKGYFADMTAIILFQDVVIGNAYLYEPPFDQGELLQVSRGDRAPMLVDRRTAHVVGPNF